MKIRVHIQVYWRITSSARIVLEVDAAGGLFYILCRHKRPSRWCSKRPTTLGNADSEFFFDIEAAAENIASDWLRKYSEWEDNKQSYNCADAVQWFLTKYAHIPAPAFYSAPLSINHLILGLPLPSILPFPVNLPGRVMDNARFHILSRTQSKQEAYKNLIIGLLATIALTGLIIVGSYLTGGLLLGIMVAVGSYGLFHSVNKTAMGFFKINPCQSPVSSRLLSRSFAFLPV